MLSNISQTPAQTKNIYYMILFYDILENIKIWGQKSNQRLSETGGRGEEIELYQMIINVYISIVVEDANQLYVLSNL